MKSLQSASVILGKFIKAKAVKKTDEEVLAGFGAEKGDSDEDSLGQSMRADGKICTFFLIFLVFSILLFPICELSKSLCFVLYNTLFLNPNLIIPMGFYIK